MSEIDYAVVVPRLRAIVARGLSSGVGVRGKQVCIEAAVCEALGLPHGDDPGCVVEDLRAYKIDLNDAKGWVSPQSRADGLLALGIAQLGSKGVLQVGAFSHLMTEKTIRVLIPTLFRTVFAHGPQACLDVADRCEREGTRAAAAAAWAEALRAASSEATLGAARAARLVLDWSAALVTVSASAPTRAECPEKYLRLSVALALDVLRELGSPGVAWLDVGEEGRGR